MATVLWLNSYSLLVNYVLYSRDFQWGTTRLSGESFITPSLKHFWVSNLKGSFGRWKVCKESLYFTDRKGSLFYRQEGQWEASLNCRASTCVQRLPFILLLEDFWCTGHSSHAQKIQTLPLSVYRYSENFSMQPGRRVELLSVREIAPVIQQNQDIIGQAQDVRCITRPPPFNKKQYVNTYIEI